MDDTKNQQQQQQIPPGAGAYQQPPPPGGMPPSFGFGIMGMPPGVAPPMPPAGKKGAAMAHFPTGAPAAAAAAASAPAASGGKGVGAPIRYKKAPDAPKRFKSAFIIFSAEKHKQIKEAYAKEGRTEKTTDIAKVVSESWRKLNPEEKEEWETKARKDKARYEVEKALYKGPWKVPANKRTPKDPNAPKRPMSAFLAFSNKRRASLKRQNPNATNADLSKMLSKQWKEADQDLKCKYMDEEAVLRANYKVEMAKWRKKVAEEKKAERKEREAMAMQAAEARQAMGADAAGQMGGMNMPGGMGGGDQQGTGGGGGQDGQQGGQGQGMYGNPYGGGGGGGQDGQQGGMPPNFNPAFMQNFQGGSLPGAAMQLQLSQLLAGQQFMQNPALAAQRGALGLYGQGLPNQGGGQGGGGQQMQHGMAGFGSNMPDGGMGQGQDQQQGQGGGGGGPSNQQGGSYAGGPMPGGGDQQQGGGNLNVKQENPHGGDNNYGMGFNPNAMPQDGQGQQEGAV